MTTFEERIKNNRGMDKIKFEAIRDHEYRKGNDNFFGYTYGHAASWLIWNRDKDGKIAKVNPPSTDWTRGGRFYDGPIKNWNHEIAAKLTTDIVFLAENMSLDGKAVTDGEPLFYNSRGERKIIKTFFGTEAEGAYCTDIIKSDKRIIEGVKKMPNGNMTEGELVKEYVLDHPEILKEHIQLFEKELEDIGAEKPLLIIFGIGKSGAAYELFMKGTDEKFRKERFCAVVQINHYACRGTDLEYIHDTSKKLKDYITISTDENDLTEQWRKLRKEGRHVNLEKEAKELADKKRTDGKGKGEKPSVGRENRIDPEQKQAHTNGGAVSFPEERQELRDVNKTFTELGFNMGNITVAGGSEVYTYCHFSGNTNAYIGFVISLFPNRPNDQRYRFKYQTNARNIYGSLKDRAEEMKRFFKEAEHKPSNVLDKIQFPIKDPVYDVLDILVKTSGILGYTLPDENGVKEYLAKRQ